MSRRRESSRRDDHHKGGKEREKDKDKHRDREKGKDKERERDREKGDREKGDRVRERDREKDKDRERNRGKDKDRDRGKDREKDREKDKDRDRGKDREKDRDRDREKDREKGRGERRKRERSRSNDRRRRSTDDRQKRRSRSSSDSSPIPEIKRRKKTGWDVMIPEEPEVAPTPVAPSMNPQQQRQQRRLYVGNLPTTVSELELMEFFNTAMSNANVAAIPGSPVLSAAINLEKAYAFIEFRSAEEATAGMSLDGITLQGHALRVRRPKDYQPSISEIQGIGQIESSGQRLPFPTVGVVVGGSGSSVVVGPGGIQTQLSVNLNIVSTNVADTPYKIFIGGLPLHLNEGDVKKLLSMFGQLKSFNLVRDSVSGLSKGFAFCEYADPNVTDGACLSLNGMAVGDKTLIVQRASVNPKTKTGGASNEPINPRAANMLNLSTPAAQLLATAVKNATADPTRILVLMNIINLSDFPGDLEESEYQEFIEDITEECSRYGKVLRILVPRPSSKQKNHTVEHFDGQDVDLEADEEDDDEEESEEEPPPPGFGKVFVEYELVEHARRAQTALSGRRYDGRMVITSFHPEEKWQHQVLEPDDIEPLYTPLIPLKSNQS